MSPGPFLLAHGRVTNKVHYWLPRPCRAPQSLVLASHHANVSKKQP